MSFDRSNPEHCPTCDTTLPCSHRATRPAHVAYREGRDAFNIPWSNGTPWEEIRPPCPYEADTDDVSWWRRGFQVALMRALVITAGRRAGHDLETPPPACPNCERASCPLWALASAYERPEVAAEHRLHWMLECPVAEELAHAEFDARQDCRRNTFDYRAKYRELVGRLRG